MNTENEKNLESNFSKDIIKNESVIKNEENELNPIEDRIDYPSKINRKDSNNLITKGENILNENPLKNFSVANNIENLNFLKTIGKI